MKRLYLLPLLLVLNTSGCILFDETIDPVYEVDDDHYVVVMPFKDPDFPRSAWDSPRGHEIAIRTTDYLMNNAEFYTVPYGKVLELTYLPPADEKELKDEDGKPVKKREGADDIGLDVRSLSEKELADLCGAEYVLVCKILLFQTKDPKSINMMKATATAECKLFKVAMTKEQEEKADDLTERQRRMMEARKRAGLSTNRVAVGGKWVATNIVTAHWPDDYHRQYGDVFLDEHVVREGLMDRLADKVAKLYYEHDKDELLGTAN